MAKATLLVTGTLAVAALGFQMSTAHLIAGAVITGSKQATSSRSSSATM